MAQTALAERTRLAMLAISEAKRSARGQFLRSPLYRWRHRVVPVEQFLLVPQDLRTADPSFVTEIREGQFGLAGAFALVNSLTFSPFDVTPPNACLGTRTARLWLVAASTCQW